MAYNGTRNNNYNNNRKGGFNRDQAPRKPRKETFKFKLIDVFTVNDRQNGTVEIDKNEVLSKLQFLQDRGKWTNMLTELEQKMPDTMWVASLEGIGDEVPADDSSSSSGSGGLGGFGGGMPFGPMGEMGGPDSNLPPSPADLTEVKQLRLIGYTLIMGTNLLEEQFLKQLKDSKFFEDVEGGSSLVKFTPEKEYNLSSFEILVKLKEPIRK